MNNSRERSSDLLSHLRFALETMPGSRKYVFTPATRAEIISELFDAFWGPYSYLFLPSSNTSLPLHATLSQVQGYVNQEAVVPGRPCGHILKKGESCFRCKDCALDDSCVLCSRCFHATDHTGHNVSFFIAQQSGGCCDCGDDEAWRCSIGCPYHPPSLEKTSNTNPKLSLRPISDAIPPIRDYPYRVPVPPELRQIMNRTVGYALDFILDTLDFSPDTPTLPPSEADLRLQPSADPMMKEQYSVVLWNDDKHSFDEVIQLLIDHTGRSREDAAEVTKRIDEDGREVIDMNTNVSKLLELAQALTQIDLGVTVRRSYDTFREQIVTVIIGWLLDLTQSRLGTDTLVLREVLAQELLSPRQRDQSANHSSNLQAIHSLPDVPNATRLDYLFLYHTRLWKKPRLTLKEIYTAILTLSRDHKLAVSGHFANVYHRVIDAYLLIDREAETSIKYFALQLFTVPSVAGHIVRHHHIVSRLLAIITAFFTNQISEKHILYPPNLTAFVDVDTFPFRSKRFMPVFSDLRYLCHNEPVQTMIAHNHDFLVQFVKTCQLFMCINPNKRAVTTHVEYETDAWISVFNVTLSLSRVIKVYGESYSRATTSELVQAIRTVAHYILLVCTLADGLDRPKLEPTVFHEIEFGNVTYRTVHFDVLDGWISFHHALHWLLAELFKHVELLTKESLSEINVYSTRDILMSTSEEAILSIIDFPLRVLAMIAQIRTGLWVRNGFAIRGQLLHYRDFMLRELCYDQDLYILQVALVLINPDLVLVSILDRFGLVSYFSGTALHQYDPIQLGSMVEEVFYVLITLLSETANAVPFDVEKQVRREIVHALALGGCSYTDLVKRVAERLVEDVAFERVLKEVSIFKMEGGGTATGIYELKEEVWDRGEVDPFFFHYTRNKREEVEAALKRRTKGNVIVPKVRLSKITAGPFANLAATFESEVLFQAIFYTVRNVLAEEDNTDGSSGPAPSAEAILDQVLHLIMLAMVERGEGFSTLASIRTYEEGNGLIDLLCTLESHGKHKQYKPRVSWILDEMEKYVSREVVARRVVEDTGASTATDPDELRKRAAKTRQDAIMKRMKAQQASFSLNFDDGDDDDEDAEMVDVHAEQQVSYGTCIVCQEDLNSLKAFGTLGMVQPSRMIRRQPEGSYVYLNQVLLSPASLDRCDHHPDITFPPLNADHSNNPVTSSNFDGFSPQHTRFGVHSSVCSHMMHLDCFHHYSVSIRQRHRAQATRNHPESIPRKEYICPLCKSLGNVILPVQPPSTATLNAMSFPDWIRAAGIGILKSKADALLESLQFRNGTGEFVFWSAQDAGYSTAMRNADRWEGMDTIKMVDTLMVVSKSLSQQTRHLRDRHEPEPGERGSGLYLPEELVGYTISSVEISSRGADYSDGLLVDRIAEPQMRMIRSLLTCLAKLAAVQFKGRPDEGREAIRQAIIKRLLPEWSRSSLTSFSYPLLLRDPFAVLVETASVAPEMLRHVLVLTYYACLARTVIGIISVLGKIRTYNAVHLPSRSHEDIFGDVRIFFMSVVRHSPVFEHTATIAFETFGDARMEKLLYMFTLPFLRKAAILCRAVLPNAFATVDSQLVSQSCEYSRLLNMLMIPPLCDLPNQDTLQNALSGWCAHYGHWHAATPLGFTLLLDLPVVYKLAKLPTVLDRLFDEGNNKRVCARCNTVPADAAICLLCGTLCCYQSDCCVDIDVYERRGECNMHMRECGGSIGIYFLVKRCLIVLLYANNGAFWQSPYLDVHGEADLAMRRGRRQYLHYARWEELRKMWLNHQIPTIIARKLESTIDSGGWETL